MKKFASLLLALVMCLCCLTTAALAERAPVAKDDLKIGFIFLHDENSTYDLNSSPRRRLPARSWASPTKPRPTSPKVRNATTQLLNWRTQAATSFLRTLSVMNPT